MGPPVASRPARVARIPYLNAAPFHLDWDRLAPASEGRWSTTILAPRQLGIAAERGEVDAGLLAVADLIRLQETFEPLAIPASDGSAFPASTGSGFPASTGSAPGAPARSVLPTSTGPVSFGIANREHVNSVLLFLRQPPGSDEAAATEDLSPEEARSLDGSRIGITGESSTSFRLLRLLLEARFHVRPAAYERVDPSIPREPRLAAMLVIGDLALRWRRRPPPGLAQRMDLAHSWHRWTGLPFVFARWGVRKSVAGESKIWLGRFLELSLRGFEGRIDELVSSAPAELGSGRELAEYLENFTYRLGPEELHAAEVFESRLREHGISCTAD
jgi:predicted solute-binding protein